jgi:anti-sigma factor RsiW
MREHLSREQISSLLDEPESVSGGTEHIRACAECAREYEQMSRMRMALSALPQLAPPVGAWEAIRARLGHESVDRRARVRSFPARVRPMWAAAVVALFAAGLGVGRLLSPGADPAGADAVASGGAASPPGAALLADAEDRGATEAYVRTAARLQELRDQGPTGPEIAADPAAAAERLMRLDALIEASREALRSAPADPVLNNFLFDVVDEREAVAGELGRALRLTSAEY